MGAQLMAIVAEASGNRYYLAPNEEHEQAADVGRPTDVPDAEIPYNPRHLTAPNYGMTTWADLFTSRQLTTLTVLSDMVMDTRMRVHSDAEHAGISDSEASRYADAMATYLAFVIDKTADRNSTICGWEPNMNRLRGTFQRQALPMSWDYAEANPMGGAGGDVEMSIVSLSEVLERLHSSVPAYAIQADAVRYRRASRQIAISTDPPYYDNVPYSDISDFFYVWLRRSLRSIYPDLVGTVLTPKSDELVADQIRLGGKVEANRFFENGFREVFRRIRENTLASIPVTVFYAFKQVESGEGGDASTGWETLLEGMIQSGWEITGTWPIRTEMATRTRGMDSNVLASSVVLACRPRAEGAASTDRRGFLALMREELPRRLKELQQGNIAPVDLAQAAIGPGMALFSRHRQVAEPDGSSMGVRTALQLINQVLDEVLAEQEGDFDTDSRWCVKWFDQMGWAAGEYGRAEILATALNTSVPGLERAGVLWARAGKVQLLRPDELLDSYDPVKDERPTMWEAVLHLSKRLEKYGPDSAGQLMRQLQSVMDLNGVKELAYLLYSVCDRKRRQESALVFNNLVTSWPEIADAAQNAPVMPNYQQAMDFTEE